MRLNKKERILLYGSNLWYLGAGMLGPLFAIFAERVGGDIFDITSAWATYLIVSGLLIIFVGKVSDKTNKKKLVLAGYILNALFTFGYLFVDNPLKLLF